MKLDKKIKYAIQVTCDELHGASSLAAKTGINKSNISRWLSGKTTHISDRNWDALLPFIAKHLQQKVSLKDKSPGAASTYLFDLVNKLNSDASFVDTPGIFKPVKLITTAAAEEAGSFVPTNDGVGLDDQTVYFPFALQTDLVVQVNGDSMSPWYPNGTFLLISTTQFPVTGDRVVAITEDNEIIFKVFVDKGDSIKLLSINHDNKKNRIISKRSETRIYPVKMSLRDERILDNEMKRHGHRHFWEKELDKENK